MPPIWYPPKTYYAGKKPNYEDLNKYIRDNMLFLKTRPFDTAATGNISTSSTTFVEATNTSLTLTTYGGDILYWVTGQSWNAGVGAFNTYDLAVDGVRQGHTTFGTTIITTAAANYSDNLNLIMVTTNPIFAGTHAVSLFWKTSVSGTANANLYVNALEWR
jgi:hypothetical protein